MGDFGKLLLNLAAVLVIVAVLLRMTFVEVVTVTDNGMAPTLVYGDQVLVWKGAHVDMADVVVCENPAQSGQRLIGRAVAFAGHTIHTDFNGMLYVDNNQTTTQGAGRVHFYDVTRKRDQDMLVGQIDYFGKHSHEFFLENGDQLSLPTYRVEKGVYLLGDNRSERSFDSREVGEVDPDHCLGQVFMRWKPAPLGSDELHHHMLDFIR
jgi:signal peptidase I